jgi:hypothetical protein
MKLIEKIIVGFFNKVGFLMSLHKHLSKRNFNIFSIQHAKILLAADRNLFINY